MIRRSILAVCCAMALATAFSGSTAQAQQAYGRQWGRTSGAQDWNRFYHYPYVWYPQNFWSRDYYKSSEDLYYRYPQEMRVPVFNQKGGGGKTATVVNPGTVLARQKKPALLIDLNPPPSVRDSRRGLGQGRSRSIPFAAKGRACSSGRWRDTTCWQVMIAGAI